MEISRRDALMGDDPLIALGRQWQEAYDNWLQFSTDGDSTEKIVELENQREGLGNIAWRIEDQAAEIPAQSIDGVLVQLRMAGTHYHLMERDGLNWHDKYAQLTWQAWDGLEHVAGRLAPEDPVLALKREWDARYRRLDDARGDDVSDETLEPFYKRLGEAEYQIFQTPATTPAGIAVKLILWARQHVEGRYEGGADWSRTPVTDYPRDLDHLPVVSALHDLERLAGETRP